MAALTGRYPSRYGVNSVFGAVNPGPEQPDWLDVRAPTTARLLQEAGYRTAHFGKWHMGKKEGCPHLMEYGFDEAAAYHGRSDKINKKAIGTRAAEFILENKENPFYLNVWIHESHTSHNPSAESLELWKDEKNEQRRIYGAVLSDGDKEVGKVLKALEDAGIAENTIVVFSSDNGPETTGDEKKKGKPGKLGSFYSIGETGGFRGEKRSLYEGGVRVPFIVRWPEHTPIGMINKTSVVTAVDLLPTFCAAAGVTVPESALCDGENMLAAFKGDTIARTRPIYWFTNGKASNPDWWPRLAVREGDWKIVLDYDGSHVELHNLINDPFEKVANDLSADYPEITERLKGMALKWHAELPMEVDSTCLTGYAR